MITTRIARQKPPSFRVTDLGFVVLCALLPMLCACTTPVHVDSAFPRPVVASLPVAVAVYYDDSWCHYTFEKEADANSLAWNIEIGPAHVRLYDRLFQPLFENLVHVNKLPPDSGDPEVSIVIKPSIDEYSLQTPIDTATDFYAVEIRYHLAFYSGSGEFIKRWSYFGKGSSRSEMFGADESVHKATVAAMRDAAAWLVIELTRQPGFHTQLQAQQDDDGKNPDDHES